MKQQATRAIKIVYKGVQLDSLLELKFVLLIEDKCSWLREHKAFFYDPSTLMPVNYIKENTKKYTPDFLVRKWCDNSAYIIELKTEAFKNSEQMKVREQIINNYIEKNNLDWKYVALSEADVNLNEEQMKKFKEVKYAKESYRQKKTLDKSYKLTKRQYSSVPTLDTNEISTEDYRRYVKYGVLPNRDIESNE